MLLTLFSYFLFQLISKISAKCQLLQFFFLQNNVIFAINTGADIYVYKLLNVCFDK